MQAGRINLLGGRGWKAYLGRNHTACQTEPGDAGKTRRKLDKMSDTDLVKLYSGRILALAADIPHLGHLAAPMATVKKRSPLCGSTVAVEVVLQGGKITQFAQEVRACALGQASAAVLGGVAKRAGFVGYPNCAVPGAP